MEAFLESFTEVVTILLFAAHLSWLIRDNKAKKNAKAA